MRSPSVAIFVGISAMLLLGSTMITVPAHADVEIDFTTGSRGSDGYKLKIVAIGQVLIDPTISFCELAVTDADTTSLAAGTEAVPVPLSETTTAFSITVNEPDIIPLTRYNVGDSVTVTGALTCVALDQTTVIAEATDTQTLTVQAG